MLGGFGIPRNLEFNVGIEAATKSRMFELRLEPDTLRAVAGVAGRIVITVYAPKRISELPTAPERKRVRRISPRVNLRAINSSAPP